ncbi:hypothetical protein BGZ76_006695, partial [Entomortierella beljakovae]
MTERQAQERNQPFRVSVESETIFIPTHYDTSIGKDIVLWDDILSVFKNAEHIRSGPYAIMFVKGSDFRNLIPLRIQADHETTFEVIMKEMEKTNEQADIDNTYTTKESAVNTKPSNEFEQLNSMDSSTVPTSNQSVEVVSNPYSASIQTITEGTKNESGSLDDGNKAQIRAEDTDFIRHYEAGLEHEKGNG